MRGVYIAEAKISSLAAAKTVMLLEAASGKAIEVLSAVCVEVDKAASSQQVECTLARVTTLGSPAGTSVTPNPTEAGDQASTTTVLANLTAEPTTYGVNADHDGGSSLGGYRYQPIPEERALDAMAGSIGLRLINVPNSGDFVVRVNYREVG